jgi:NTE family protein
MPFGDEGIQPGIGLALSGGGFRATLFHIGSLWRLNELGYLPKLDRISSISGGSITAGLLGVRWNKLQFQNSVANNFTAEIVAPLRKFCSRNVDLISIGIGALLPGITISDMVREAYEDHLLGEGSLQTLPDKPRFVINATNFATGVSFRFSKPYAGDYRIGLIKNPNIRISFAVTASSAFPPVLSPATLNVDPNSFEKVEGADLFDEVSYRKRLVLTDGGVYDNLGLETVWNRYKMVLVSDAGAPFDSDSAFGPRLDKQVLRALDITTNQSRGLRKRALISDYVAGAREGTYWGIMTRIAKYGPPAGSLAVAPQKTDELAGIRTRLNKFSEREQCELINWGYAVCDAAMRRDVLAKLPAGTPIPPSAWPYPNFPL